MDERWQEIERIYHAARELDASARAEFFAKACAGDDDLRQEVERLLVHRDQAGSFLETPAVEVAAESLAKEKQLSDPAKPALESGTMVAHYRLAEKIGEGGMGEVYRARDTKLQRDVALKVLPQALAHDSERMARFEREAQVLASLNHPNIAAIYGLEESNGIRALAMELVEGETLGERLRPAQPLTRPPALRDDTLSPPAGRGEKSPDLRPVSPGRGEQLNDLIPSPQGRGWPPGVGPGEGSRGSALVADDALHIARQIAEALEYAHEHGIIHRDLKPANVKITPEGTVKVLDFGLAKVLNPQDSTGADPANSPTLITLATQPGVLLGTAAYMSPEQAKGQRVDRRCDIWAFGCVLYEMLSGRKAFDGETISDVLAAVLTKEPDWNALPGTTPLSIQKLIGRCLQKDLRQRQRDIGDARITIEETMSGTGVPPVDSYGQDGHATGAPRRALPWALAAVGLVAAMILAFVAMRYLRQPAANQSAIRFFISPPENATFDAFSLSPDGRKLAFVTPNTVSKPRLLWVRALDSLTPEALEGTEGAESPFWSPGSRYIGFYAEGKLKKIAASGGPSVILCDANAGNGATWSQEGVILFSNEGNLYRVPDAGGAPALVAAPDVTRHEIGYTLPQFLPDGRHFLFIAHTPETSVKVGSLGSKRTEPILTASSNAHYAAPGYLFYMAGSTLMARPFEAKRLRFTGEATSLAVAVGMSGPGPFAFGNFSVSQTGVVAYETGEATNSRMTWFNRNGERLGTVGQPGLFTNPALSRDGTKLAVGVGPSTQRDIWVFDLKRGTGSRLTFNPADDLNPAWAPDGSRIMFTSTRRAQRDIYEKLANGLGNTEPVFASKQHAKPVDDWSPDGRYVIYDTGGSGTITELWVLPLFGERKAFAYIQGGFLVSEAQFSPNVRYVAYASQETGESQIYVQTFPEHLGKWQISSSGGTEPMWRRDGRELFYLSRNDELMSVRVSAGSGPFRAGVPKPLFQTHLIPAWYWRNRYVVSPDGQRFLMLVPAGEAKPEPITVVVNWPALLKNAGQ